MGNSYSNNTEMVENKVLAYAVLGYQQRRGKGEKLVGLTRQELEKDINDERWPEKVESFVSNLIETGNIEQFLSETYHRLVVHEPAPARSVAPRAAARVEDEEERYETRRQTQTRRATQKRGYEEEEEEEDHQLPTESDDESADDVDFD